MSTPYPQKRQPAKRISLKKHESAIAVKDQEIKQLKDDISFYKQSSKAGWGTANHKQAELDRANKIIDKLVQ